MLRRYTSAGLENHVFSGPTTLIGSSNLCDVVVKGAGVADRHALVEYHPIVRSYWLRDLGSLGGTVVNDQTIYGMVELKSADVLKFGKSSDFVFDFPLIQPSPERSRRSSTRIGHSQCTENGFKDKDNKDSNVVLPVVGNKITPKPSAERFSRAAVIPHKKLCQQQPPPNPESDSSMTSMSAATIPTVSKNAKNIRPISSKIRNTRSMSAGPVRDTTTSTNGQNTVKNGGKKLPSLKMPKLGSHSSGYSSSELNSFLPQINGFDKKNKNNLGNQLLQRIVKLQQELHRKDEEIIKLKENATIPSTTGERVQKHLDDYRLALAEAEVENTKLRAIIMDEVNKNPEKIYENMAQRLQKAETDQRLTELVYKTFFAVSVDEMENVNKTCVKFNAIKENKYQHINSSTARDYSDVIGDIVRILQDPFSFRLMEITTKCNKRFDKENLTKPQKRQAAEMFDNFLKQIIYPLAKALDTFLPVIKDVSTMARESAKACNIFSQWSRDFGDQMLHDIYSWDLLLFKIDELQSRFRENGIPRHWIPPSITPLFKLIVSDMKRLHESTKQGLPVTETSRSDPNFHSPVVNVPNAVFDRMDSEVKKLKSKNRELQETIEQLRTEKEQLISQMGSIEDSKYSMDNSGIRARRAAANLPNLLTETEPVRRPITPAPSIELHHVDDDGVSEDAGSVVGELNNVQERVENEAQKEENVETKIPRINLQQSVEELDDGDVHSGRQEETGDNFGEIKKEEHVLQTSTNGNVEERSDEDDKENVSEIDTQKKEGKRDSNASNSHGETPEKLDELIHEHDDAAQPPSEVDQDSNGPGSLAEDDTEVKEFKQLEERVEEGTHVDADDEESDASNVGDKDLIQNEEESYEEPASSPISRDSDGRPVGEDEEWITGTNGGQVPVEGSDEEGTLVDDEDDELEDYEKAKLIHDDVGDSEEFTAESLEDLHGGEDEVSDVDLSSTAPIDEHVEALEHMEDANNDGVEEVSTPGTPRVEKDDIHPEEILDVGQMPSDDESKNHNNDFWHLARALANLLRVHVEDDSETETTTEEAEKEEKRKKRMLNGLVKEMEALLDRLKQQQK